MQLKINYIYELIFIPSLSLTSLKVRITFIPASFKVKQFFFVHTKDLTLIERIKSWELLQFNNCTKGTSFFLNI
jgi:hypothetical protein